MRKTLKSLMIDKSSLISNFTLLHWELDSISLIGLTWFSKKLKTK
jgi:hypothetical protein